MARQEAHTRNRRRGSKHSETNDMRILVAEDEQDINKFYDWTLTDRGHEVILTSNGEECLNLYRQRLKEQQQKQEKQLHNDENGSLYSSSPPFDVVILDYKMPKKDGLQVAKEILDMNPDQRIIFASAYAHETLAESVKKLRRVVELLQKPFSTSALVDTVENREAYEGLKTLMTTARDVIKDLDNPSCDQIRDLFEGLKKVQKFKGFY